MKEELKVKDNGGRQVIVYYMEKRTWEEEGQVRSKWFKDTKCIGTFHGWGVDYQEFDEGVGNFTVAIVELEDGTVELVLAGMIRFMDEGKTHSEYDIHNVATGRSEEWDDNADSSGSANMETP